jgi:Methyladenine glycosylase
MNDERHQRARRRDSAEPRNCDWAPKPASIQYHDKEWDVPLDSNSSLFKQVIHEGAQAGFVERIRPAQKQKSCKIGGRA